VIWLVVKAARLAVVNPATCDVLSDTIWSDDGQAGWLEHLPVLGYRDL
jgi:hypothetical protein